MRTLQVCHGSGSLQGEASVLYYSEWLLWSSGQQVAAAWCAQFKPSLSGVSGGTHGCRQEMTGTRSPAMRIRPSHETYSEHFLQAGTQPP